MRCCFRIAAQPGQIVTPLALDNSLYFPIPPSYASCSELHRCHADP